MILCSGISSPRFPHRERPGGAGVLRCDPPMFRVLLACAYTLQQLETAVGGMAFSDDSGRYYLVLGHALFKPIYHTQPPVNFTYFLLETKKRHDTHSQRMGYVVSSLFISPESLFRPGLSLWPIHKGPLSAQKHHPLRPLG